MVAAIDMTGKKLCGLNIISSAGSRDGKLDWNCQCHCGNIFVARGTSLRSNQVSGCPACSLEKCKSLLTTHGGCYSKEYIAYGAMKQRCYYQKNKRYNRYGGRGITVCHRWLESFENFLADMGEKPSDDHSIERIDNNGNYEPGNCRWATRVEQANNRKNNTRIEINGRIQNLTQWSKESGINRTVILRRLKRGITGIKLITKGIIR